MLPVTFCRLLGCAIVRPTLGVGREADLRPARQEPFEPDSVSTGVGIGSSPKIPSTGHNRISADRIRDPSHE